MYYQKSLCRCDFEVTTNYDGLLVCGVYPHSRHSMLPVYDDEQGADVIHMESSLKQFNELFATSVGICEMGDSEWRLQGIDKEILAFIKWVK